MNNLIETMLLKLKKDAGSIKNKDVWDLEIRSEPFDFTTMEVSTSLTIILSNHNKEITHRLSCIEEDEHYACWRYHFDDLFEAPADHVMGEHLAEWICDLMKESNNDDG